jgi:hypothetical protein
MATISNGREGAARLALELEVSRPVRETGMVHRGCVALNSRLDLVLAEVVYVVGEAEYFSHEVLLQSGDLRAFADGVLQLLQGTIGEVALDIGSPELGLELRRHDRPTNGRRSTALMRRNPSPRLTLLAYVDIGVMAGADTVSRAGPALLLEPTVAETREFGRDLRSEVELALCL